MSENTLENTLEKNTNSESSCTCQYCGKTYSSKSNLKAHQQRTKKCIDLRTNSILLKELISNETRDNNSIHSNSINTECTSAKNTPTCIYRSLSNISQTSTNCQSCIKLQLQINTIVALNNKMFGQLVNMCGQLNNLTIVVDNLKLKNSN